MKTLQRSTCKILSESPQTELFLQYLDIEGAPPSLITINTGQFSFKVDHNIKSPRTDLVLVVVYVRLVMAVVLATRPTHSGPADTGLAGLARFHCSDEEK